MKKAVKKRRKRASASKPEKLPEFVAKRYAALLAYMENCYPKPKDLKALAKQVQLDAIELARIRKSGNAPTVSQQMAKAEGDGS